MIRSRQSSLFHVRRVLLLILMAAVYTLSGCAETYTNGPVQQTLDDGMPAGIAVDQLQPGLSVLYFHDKYRHIEEMPVEKKSLEKYGHPGPPVLKLDHRFGRKEVFASGRSERVGMLMTGYFFLEQPGTYRFQANSNDGFRMLLNGNVIVDDPTIHADKLSDPGSFQVNKGGLFPVKLKYFQRKGTATLQLFWQPPGTDTFTIVPEAVYFHNP